LWFCSKVAEREEEGEGKKGILNLVHGGRKE